jgi:hypothetical protein
MASLHRDPRFKLRALTSALLVCSMGLAASSVFALQEIADEDLGDSTGEGIAFLPENAFFTFRGAGANESLNTILTDRTNDTGYIRYIPVGPLTKDAQDTNKDTFVNGADRAVGKADLFLYGLAVSKQDGDTNSRLSATDPYIGKWGSAENPWLFKVDTALNVPTFNPDTFSGSTRNPNTQTGSVTYLSLEAPLRHAINITGDGTPGNPYVYTDTKPTTAAAGGDAYKLKLAFWADAFVRNPAIVEDMGNTGNQFNQGALNGTTSTTRENRVRLQAVWNGLSLNGSRIQMFQTLNGATNTNGMSEFYNNTLGIAGVLRFNTGDGETLRATVTDNTVQGSSTGNWVTINDGAGTTFGTGATTCGNGGSGAFSTAVSCRYIVQNRTRTDTATRTRTWTVPSDLNSRALRFSTQECGPGNPNGCTSPASQGLLSTPAINGGAAPSFAPGEGLFVYNLNTNLVLGSLYQPLVIGSDGKNFSLEVARIPNKQEIYRQIYTRYAGDTNDAGVTYLGSTCNYYKCGTSQTLGGTSYQNYNATHSSITIGSTSYNPATNSLTAYSGEGALGVSFGALQSNSVSATTNAILKEVQYKQRALLTRSWRYQYVCGTFSGCNDTTYTLSEWVYNSGAGNVFWNSPTLPANSPTCTPNFFGNCSSATSGPNNNIFSTSPNRNWSATTSPAVWLTASNAEVNAMIGAVNGVTGVPAANQAATPVVGSATPLNNLGSAVIDGLLIQHLKITTKGL